MAVKETGKFSVGSKVVYPSHGIGTIHKIELQSIAGNDESCYVISFVGGMTIMAPVKTAGHVGLRSIIAKREVAKVLRILRESENGMMESNWNKRQKVYHEKIKSGSIFEVADVFRDLNLLRERKGLSFGEQQVFDNAKKLIVSEVAIAKGLEESAAQKLIDTALTH